MKAREERHRITRVFGQHVSPAVMNAPLDQRDSAEAIVGNIGSSLREEYTIIDDAVNWAARIEPLNKTYGSTILLSRETLDASMREVPAI